MSLADQSEAATNLGKRKRGSSNPYHASKLARLPSTHRVQKRPLMHPPIPSPYASASQQKVVYISLRTPFMSAVRRVRDLLKHVESRESQSVVAGVNDIRNRNQYRHGRGDKILATALAAAEVRDSKARSGKAEEVVIKGTGRAIEKVLELAEFFKQREGEEGVRVVMRTGSVWAIDDVVERTEEEMDALRQWDRKSTTPTKATTNDKETRVRQVDAMDENSTTGNGMADYDQAIPDSRLRQTSVLEVGLSLR